MQAVGSPNKVTASQDDRLNLGHRIVGLMWLLMNKGII
jgi:hypothetical protein